VVRRRADFGAFAFAFARVRDLECLAGFAALATGRRDGRRAFPLTLRCDAAFNCYPLPYEFETPACEPSFELFGIAATVT
jgi:hypothetical protein